jgi:hypothetical protein
MCNLHIDILLWYYLFQTYFLICITEWSKSHCAPDKHKYISHDERRGRVVSTPALYSEYPGSNLCNCDWLSWCFSWFSSVPLSKCRNSTLKLGHDRFLPSHNSSSIVTSSSTLYSLVTEKESGNNQPIMVNLRLQCGTTAWRNVTVNVIQSHDTPLGGIPASNTSCFKGVQGLLNHREFCYRPTEWVEIGMIVSRCGS